MHEAHLYEKLPGKKVKCQVCQRRCVIPEGQVGFCLSRLNKDGKLYSLLYGIVNGHLQVDPIEKKPFYHFKPGSQVVSVGSFGCNFRCKQCLNWWTSWGQPATANLEKLAKEKSWSLESCLEIQPEKIIDTVVKKGYQGIALTYNEPVIWLEFAYDLARLAKKANLFTVFVTNGSWTKETIDHLSDKDNPCQSLPNQSLIDAANIDFKGFSEKTYAKQNAFFGQIPQMTKYAQEKYKLHLEITTLLIPTINDDPEELKQMTGWIAKNLGPDTPWHLSQFDPTSAPDPEFQKIPFTSVEQLEKAAEIGKKAGLNHIYIWAPTSGYSRSDTLCPKCKKIVIKRSAWKPEEINITQKGTCQFCGCKLNIIF